MLKSIFGTLLFVGFLLPAGVATATKPDENGEHKVTICHRTEATEKNPWVVIKVDEEGLNGHGDHEGDIIPITDVNEDGKINKKDCKLAGGGGEEEDTVKVCHLTGQDDPLYEVKDIPEDEVAGHLEHGDVLADNGECPGKGGGGGTPTPTPIALSPLVTSRPVVLEGFGGGSPQTLPVTGFDPIMLSFVYATMLMTVISALKIAKEEA